VPELASIGLPEESGGCSCGGGEDPAEKPKSVWWNPFGKLFPTEPAGCCVEQTPDECGKDCADSGECGEDCGDCRSCQIRDLARPAVTVGLPPDHEDWEIKVVSKDEE